MKEEAVGDTEITTLRKKLSKRPEINKLANIIDYGIEKITEFRQKGVNDETLEECFVGLYSSVYSSLIASLYSTFEGSLRREKITKEEFRQVTELLDQWKKGAASGNVTKEDYEEFMRDVKKFDEKYPEFFADGITMSNFIKEFEEALKVNELIKKLDMCKKGKVETKELKSLYGSVAYITVLIITLVVLLTPGAITPVLSLIAILPSFLIGFLIALVIAFFATTISSVLNAILELFGHPIGVIDIETAFLIGGVGGMIAVGGTIGVAVFIVLSAIIITSKLLGAIKT